MTILLTAAAVLLVLGLVLMFLGITGRRDVREPAIPTTADAGPPGTAPAGNVDYAPVTSRSSRKMRTVPLIFGLLLALAGGIGLALILREGLESDRVDRWMLTKWPAGSLAGDLDDPDPVTTHEAKVELKRRYEAGELSEDVERSLAERKMRKVLAAPGDESAPYHIVDVDLGEARKKGLIEDERWGEYIVKNYPKSVRLSDNVPPGDPLTLRVLPAIEQPDDPAWMLLVLDQIKLAGRPLPADQMPQAIVVARNPNWAPPEPPPAPEQRGDQPPQAPPPARPPQVRTEVQDQIAAALVQEVGQGQHEFTARLRAFAFDPGTVPPPEDAVREAASKLPGSPTVRDPATGPATRRANIPAVVAARISIQEAETLAGKALSSQEWTIRRQVQVGQPASDAPASTAPATRPTGDASRREQE